MNRKNNTTIGLDIAKNVFHYAQLNRNEQIRLGSRVNPISPRALLSYIARFNLSTHVVSNQIIYTNKKFVMVNDNTLPISF